MNAPKGGFDRQQDVTLITADAEAGIAGLPDESVDCLVTSPPYWRLRDYAPGTWTGGSPACRHRPAGTGAASGDDRSRRCRCRDCGALREHPQIGLEPTADEHVSTLRAVFYAARRVLKPRATVWINLGDSYSTNSDGYWCASPGQAGQPHYRPVADVPHKNLLGMPWRVAFALQSDGWILRSAIVWHKPYANPTPIRDRLATRHEMIFLFVTQPDYHFTLDPTGLAYTSDRVSSHRADPVDGTASAARRTGLAVATKRPRDRDFGDVWTIRPDRSSAGHPAPSPLEIPRRCIAAGSPSAGHVLDPFSGSGTTGVAARELGRRFTGIDTNAEYHEIARRRLDDVHHAEQRGAR
ncbi:DNA-methyltransferase [Amycolatopsis sp. cmx-4-68]|uniref:DNA-methyltransferase n=1 Tax=Amycolatopsis sp. cmx-4-68 TaxID=2790938 RepID=UPI00397AE2AB